MSDPIIVVEYDPGWVGAFAEERVRIEAALGELAFAIEHYGSTAVPGLAAKPIIDVMVGVSDLDSTDDVVERLVHTGYERRPTGDLERPRRLFFVRYDGDRRAAHLALVELNGDYWPEHVAFRDALRSDAHLARRYAELKRKLAVRFRRDRLAYTQGKDEFVAEALRSLASPE